MRILYVRDRRRQPSPYPVLLMRATSRLMLMSDGVVVDFVVIVQIDKGQRELETRGARAQAGNDEPEYGDSTFVKRNCCC